MNADEAVSNVGEEIVGNNLYVYCFNNPIIYTDSAGSWPKWLEKTIDSAKQFFDDTIDFMKQVAQSAVDNFSASAGVGIGIGGSVKLGNVSINAVTKVDAIAVQFEDGEFRVGHMGESSLSVGYNEYYLGVQNHTYESFDGTINERKHSGFDGGISYGKSNYCIIGWHYNISFSIKGFFEDIYSYYDERWSQ